VRGGKGTSTQLKRRGRHKLLREKNLSGVDAAKEQNTFLSAGQKIQVPEKKSQSRKESGPA